MADLASESRQVLIIGAGPAGLTAARHLAQAGRSPLVLERLGKVGGLARTEEFKGYHFDMGGHRFFTKSEEVNDLWHEVLEGDFIRRRRLSRIFYNRKFFYYPLRPLNVLWTLGIWESLRIFGSYVRWQIFPYPQEESFEQWVTNRFGRRLFETFFKTYTEKVWGIACSELKAEWAAQRIKDLSLRTALVNMLSVRPTKIKTLIEEFDYPRIGPGMMWSAFRTEIENDGGEVRLHSDVDQVFRDGATLTGVAYQREGRQEIVQASELISSMPISLLVQKLDPPPPAEVVTAARELRYRDFLTVCLVVNKPDLFPDNWIYVHDPVATVGRIQNFKNWSPEMVPDPSRSSLGLEYFCDEGDNLWNRTDEELIELGKRDLQRIRLADPEQVLDGCVFRIPKAYPVYDSDYREHLATVRDYVEGLENFQTIGRNGLHRYNNQDHSMITGIEAARGLLSGQRRDLWELDDRAYHEEVLVNQGLVETFQKLDRWSLGLAVGIVSGLLLFLSTLWATGLGNEGGQWHLGLLAHFFPGYRVSILGSLLGGLYGFAVGFVLGWGFGTLRNATVFLTMVLIRRRAERPTLRRLMDYL